LENKTVTSLFTYVQMLTQRPFWWNSSSVVSSLWLDQAKNQAITSQRTYTLPTLYQLNKHTSNSIITGLSKSLPCEVVQPDHWIFAVSYTTACAYGLVNQIDLYSVRIQYQP